MSMKNFESWYTSFMNEGEETAVAHPTVTSNDISGDVDTIINSLETLANELREELKTIESGAIHEANPVDFVKSWITSLMAVSAQKKVNKIRLNAADIEIAAKKAEGDAKSNLEDKADMAKDQASDLQDMVNDKFKGKGAIVDRKLAQAKIEGQIAIIKRTTGMEDDPSVQADLKTKLKELADKYREESDAIKSIEDENKEAIEAEKERIRQERESERETQTRDTEETPETATSKDDTEDTISKDDTTTKDDTESNDDTSPKDDTETKDDAETNNDAEPDPTAEKEAAIAQYDTNIKDEVARKTSLQNKLKEATDELTTTTDKSSTEAKITAIKTEIEKSDEDIKQMKAEKAKLVKELSKEPSAKESLVTRATNLGATHLVEEISGKLDWQLENNSVLYVKYNTELSKMENINRLNENKYSDLDIKSRFSRLMS